MKKKETKDILILMSIITYYCNQIFNGTKKYEFRKSPLPNDSLNKKIYIYSAKDEKAIVGYFKVSKVLTGTTEQILKLTGYYDSEDKEDIENYFGKDNLKCYALEISEVKRFDSPIYLKDIRQFDPKISLPQYYKYIYEGSKLYKYLKNLEKDN